MTNPDDYWDGYDQYDQVAESLKEALTVSVKAEITERIKDLEAENSKLNAKLHNLIVLEGEAARAKSRYEAEFTQARSAAVQQVRKEKLTELLAAIDERIYMIEHVYTMRDKCDLCDADRRLNYTTPSGKNAWEACDCSQRDHHLAATEAVAYDISRRDGKMIFFYRPTSRWDDSDSLDGPSVYKRAESEPAADVMKSPTSYAFRDLASAQAVADNLNPEATK